MDARDWRDALGPTLALATVLAGSRLVKMGITLRIEDLIGGIPLSKRLAEAAILAVLSSALWWVARWRAKTGGRVGPAAAVLATVAVGISLFRHAGHGISGLERSAAVRDPWLFGVLFRGDLTFVATFAVLILAACAKLRGRWRTAAVAALGCLAWIVAALSGLELAYFRSTGQLGDGFILKYGLSNFGNVAFIVRNELDATNVAMILAASAWLPAALWLVRRAALAPALSRLPRVAPSPWGVVAAAAVLWALPNSVPPLPYNYARLAPVFQARLIADLIGDPFWSLAAANALNRHRPPVADTRRLSFVPTKEEPRYNLVFVILESARARSVTPYNPAILNTPFLDELAKKSLVTDEMYTVIPHTARAWTAILTGLYPVTNAVSTWSDADSSGASLASVPRLLRPYGYASAFFTPAHTKFEKDAQLIDNRGFDQVRSDGDYDTTGFERTNYFGYEDRVMLAPSLAWVDEKVARKQPFFLTYMTLTGHHDYQVPSTYPKTRYPGVADDELNDYLNALHYVDDWLRDVFHAFEERGLMDSTVFIVLGDHGESFGEHGPRQHIGVMYEEALKIPLLIFSPALSLKPGRILGLRQQIDVLPTVADLLGYEIRDGYVPGVSLLKPVPADRTLYFSGSQENLYMALRRGRMKYIYFFRREPLQAFDIDADPYERNDLAAALPAGEADRIERELFGWRQRAVDVFLDGARRDDAAAARSNR